MPARYLEDHELRRFQAVIPNARNLSFPFVLLLDNGTAMRNLGTSGSERPLILEGATDHYYMRENDTLLVVETPHYPDWNETRVVWERHGPCAGSPAILSFETKSGKAWQKSAGEIMLRKIPLQNVDASRTLIEGAIKKGMRPVVLKIPIPELGIAGVEVKLIVFGLTAEDDEDPIDAGEGKEQRIFGLTYSIGARPLEVVFYFGKGDGYAMIRPFEDGGL